MSEHPSPPDWEDKRKEAVAELGKLPNQTEFPIVVPNSLAWVILKSQLFDAGAEAIYSFAKEEGRKEAISEAIREI